MKRMGWMGLSILSMGMGCTREQHVAEAPRPVQPPPTTSIASPSNSSPVPKRVEQGPPRLVPQVGHAEAVYGVAWSQDGEVVLSTGWDGHTKAWAWKSGLVRAEVGEPSEHRSGMVWSRDRQRLATVSMDALSLWEASTGKLLGERREKDNRFSGVSFNPEGTRLASGGDGLKIWDLSAQSFKSFAEGEASNATYLNRVAWSPDGRYLATGSADKKVRILDTGTWKEVRSFLHDRAVASLSWSPDSRLLLSGGEDGQAKLWDIETGSQKGTFAHEGNFVRACTFHPQGRIIATAGAIATKKNTIKLWDLSTGTMLFELPEQGSIFALAFSPDGNHVASAGSSRSIRIWNTHDGKIAQTLPGASTFVNAAVWSPDGTTLAAQTVDRALLTWDIATASTKTLLPAGSSNRLQWTTNGKLVALNFAQTEVKLFDPETGAMRASLPMRSRTSAARYSPDGKTVATTSFDGEIQLWEAEKGTPLKTFRLDDGASNGLSWSPDGKSFVVWNRASTTLVDAKTGKKLASMNERDTVEVQDAVFSPDGKTIAVLAGPGWITLWKTGASKALAHIKPVLSSKESEASFDAIAFSQDGRWLATVGDDSLARVFDVATGRQVTVLNMTGRSLSFHRNGVLAVSGNGTVLVRMKDGAQLRLDALGTGHWGLVHRDGMEASFAGNPEVAGQIVFRMGDDLLSSELVTGASQEAKLRQPNLLRDFLDQAAHP